MAFAFVHVFALATAGHSLWRPPAAAVASLVPRHSPAVAAAPRPSRDSSRKAKALGTKGVAPSVEKQKHLLFDRVELTVRGGDGGDGVVVPPSGRHAARLSSGLESDLELPPGGDGGDVVLYVDPSLSDLLPLHARPKLTGERGRDSPGPLTAREVAQRAVRDSGDGSAAGVQRQQLHGAALRVGVPPGTFVRTGGGRVLGDLVSAGDEVRVAEGGAGGPCIAGAARGRAARRQQSEARRGGRRRSEEEVDAFELSEQEEIDLVRGKAAPPPTKLLLLLRTVADVGFVGFPNAGKSTLLNALTRARATINSYPFTTLMPNLGAMVPSGGEGGGGGGGGALLADLPGLVEGAHAGRGLGRQFLQQLRRVKVVLFVLDTTCAEVDVGEQYAILRRELQLYNPDYLARPHLVALNKLDTLLQAEGPAALAPETRRLTALLAAAARASAAPGDGPPTSPFAVLPISGMKGKGLRALQEAIAAALADHDAGAEGESDPPHPQ